MKKGQFTITEVRQAVILIANDLMKKDKLSRSEAFRMAWAAVKIKIELTEAKDKIVTFQFRRKDNTVRTAKCQNKNGKMIHLHGHGKVGARNIFWFDVESNTPKLFNAGRVLGIVSIQAVNEAA